MIKITTSIHDIKYWQRADRKLFPADLVIPFQNKSLEDYFDNYCRGLCTWTAYYEPPNLPRLEIEYYDKDDEAYAVLHYGLGKPAVDDRDIYSYNYNTRSVLKPEQE
jgi:hypothetical protein